MREIELEEVKKKLDSVLKNLNDIEKKIEIEEEKNLLDKKKAAKLLGISVPTLTKYIRTGMIETKRVPNSTKEYITKQTLIKFLES